MMLHLIQADDLASLEECLRLHPVSVLYTSADEPYSSLGYGIVDSFCEGTESTEFLPAYYEQAFLFLTKLIGKHPYENVGVAGPPICLQYCYAALVGQQSLDNIPDFENSISIFRVLGRGVFYTITLEENLKNLRTKN